MSDEQRQNRYLKSVAVAVAVHLGAGLVLGLVPMQKVQDKQHQIIELTLASSAPKAAAAVQQAYVPPPPPPPVQTSEDDIIDKRIKPPEEPPPVPPEVPPEGKPEAPAPFPEAAPVATGNTSGASDGSATNGASGNGDGQGEGTGSGGSGDSEVPVQRPYVTYSYKPDYPRAARNRGIEGTVYVRVLVNARGRVDEAEVDESSGNAALDTAAVDAVEGWRFSPARNSQDQAIPCYVVVPVSFVLH